MKKQDWIKSITDIELVDNTQEPFLRMKINGKWAKVPQKQTFTAIKNGCVCIVSDFGNLKPKDRSYFRNNIPTIEILINEQEEDSPKKRISLTGFTNDSRIVQLWINTFGKRLGREVKEGLTKLGYKFGNLG